MTLTGLYFRARYGLLCCWVARGDSTKLAEDTAREVEILPGQPADYRAGSDLGAPVPSRRMGVVTGQCYHFLVLDFDGTRGIQTMQRLGIQPHVRTGSGGYHAYIVYPDDLNVRTWNFKKA